MNEILKKIKEQHILYAVEQLNKYGWEARYNSTKFDLLYNEKAYPPKMVIRYQDISQKESVVYF